MKKVWENVSLIIAGMLFGGTLVNKAHGKAIDEIRENERKNFSNFKLMNSLYKAAQDELDFGAYFRQNGYDRIAIYGASYVGERLMKELQRAGVQVQYVIDKRAEKLQSSVRIYTLEERLPEVDVIIVTPTFFYREIKKELESKTRCDIIPLDDLLEYSDTDKG